MPQTPGRYSATGAPLVVGDLVISGIAGGDGPLRGFLAAYKATTGEQVCASGRFRSQVNLVQNRGAGRPLKREVPPCGHRFL